MGIPPNNEDQAALTLREGAEAVVRRLRQAGHQAVFAGGCVRDALLGRVPKDYDIATDAVPETVIGCFERTIPIGLQFGVIQVHHGEHTYEVATFRTEGGYQDGRRPETVQWANAQADVARRDFTINGLLYDPVDDVVLDYVEGRSDLAAGLIRAIGDPTERFGEDHLRILRAVRFSARFGFRIEAVTWQAMQTLAHTVPKVSPERIHHELERILTEGQADVGLTLLEDSGLRAHVLPELTQPSQAVARLAVVDQVSPAVGWALALYDIGASGDVAASVEALGRRLRFSREVIKRATAAIAGARLIADYTGLTGAARKRLLRASGVQDLMAVATAVSAAGQSDGEGLRAAETDRARWSAEDLAPRPLLDGGALRKAGYRPGPGFKTALVAIEDAQLEGRANDEAEAWLIARRVLELDQDSP
ncbi:MAG: tRNA nucleotidyltransferase/poly(A) polymerase [Myxococcota bacterium]|jgi:tRNA nucleotidyltransferase/poly(A) polymerase